MSASLVGSEMCIRDRPWSESEADLAATVEAWAADRGLAVVGPGGPARRSPAGQSWARLDWVA
eukprot:7414014-Alexandrium_andersonii.AAC.1